MDTIILVIAAVAAVGLSAYMLLNDKGSSIPVDANWRSPADPKGGWDPVPGDNPDQASCLIGPDGSPGEEGEDYQDGYGN